MGAAQYAENCAVDNTVFQLSADSSPLSPPGFQPGTWNCILRANPHNPLPQNAVQTSFLTAGLVVSVFLAASPCALSAGASAPPATGYAPQRTYENRLTPVAHPKPILADYPEFIAPIEEPARFEAPILIDDANADLQVRAWRFSYNARALIEIPNKLCAKETALIMVHPWGIDDGQGWNTPEPAGCADFCTPEKNHLAARHTREVIDPFLTKFRGKVGCVLFSLPGREDPIRRKLYRSFRGKPTAAERAQGADELRTTLSAFQYRGAPLPATIQLSANTPVRDYFAHFPGLDAGPRYNNAGFWDLPIPVTRDITMHPDDVVIYDADGYDALRDFLRSQHIRHILLTGYATDMCFCKTTAGYENLSRDFNVFLVGDATLATFPANATPRHATNAHVSFAALNQLVTQISWIRDEPPR
jgi:nicotinamidase-related amidase